MTEFQIRFSMAGSAILGITFGFEIQPHNDPYVVLAEKALHSMAMVTNSGSYVGKPLTLPKSSAIAYSYYTCAVSF